MCHVPTGRLSPRRPPTRLVLRTINNGWRAGWIAGRISRRRHDVSGGIRIIRRMRPRDSASCHTGMLGQGIRRLFGRTTYGNFEDGPHDDYRQPMSVRIHMPSLAQIFPTRSRPGFRVFSPGFQPAGQTSTPPFSRTQIFACNLRSSSSMLRPIELLCTS